MDSMSFLEPNMQPSFNDAMKLLESEDMLPDSLASILVDTDDTLGDLSSPDHAPLEFDSSSQSSALNSPDYTSPESTEHTPIPPPTNFMQVLCRREEIGFSSKPSPGLFASQSPPPQTSPSLPIRSVSQSQLQPPAPPAPSQASLQSQQQQQQQTQGFLPFPSVYIKTEEIAASTTSRSPTTTSTSSSSLTSNNGGKSSLSRSSSAYMSVSPPPPPTSSSMVDLTRPYDSTQAVLTSPDSGKGRKRSRMASSTNLAASGNLVQSNNSYHNNNNNNNSSSTNNHGGLGEEVSDSSAMMMTNGGPMFHFFGYNKYFKNRLYNSDHIDISSLVDLDIRVDKNVEWSDVDGAWIHFKQNHFQMTYEVPLLTQVQGGYTVPLMYLDTAQPNGTFARLAVDNFCVDCYSVKSSSKTTFDDPEEKVPLFQTGKSRVKEENQAPTYCPLLYGRGIHLRLRFQQSTANNARTKSNEPNPNQQYFRLVCSLMAVVQGSYYHVLSKISDPIIVRGQNPGRYKQHTSTRELSSGGEQVSSPEISQETSGPWQKNDKGIHTASKVGIGTNAVSEALTVNGNVLVTGNVLKPSDKRLKDNFREVSPAQQLENIRNLKIYDYELKQWKTDDQPLAQQQQQQQEQPQAMGDDVVTGNLQHSASNNSAASSAQPQQEQQPKVERGVIAQELQKIMPFAVNEIGDVTLSDGRVINNLLVVNERVLLFENIGATQHLSTLLQKEVEQVDRLDERVDRLEEGQNQQLQQNQELQQQQQINQLQTLVDMITSEEYGMDRESESGNCCYCSMFGLGPSWTLWVLGFFFPLFWFVGILYLTSQNDVRRWGGVANLVSFVIGMVYLWILIWFGPKYFGMEITAIFWVIWWLIGCILIVSLAYHIRKIKQRKQRQSRYKLKEFVMRPKLYAYSSLAPTLQEQQHTVPLAPTPPSEAEDDNDDHSD